VFRTSRAKLVRLPLNCFCGVRATHKCLAFCNLQFLREFWPTPLPLMMHSALVLFAQRTRIPTSARSIGFCVIWVCISSSSSSKPMLRAESYACPTSPSSCGYCAIRNYEYAAHVCFWFSREVLVLIFERSMNWKVNVSFSQKEPSRRTGNHFQSPAPTKELCAAHLSADCSH